MKANYRIRLYSEFTKRSRTIKLYQMDFGQLAEWMKTFEQTKDRYRSYYKGNNEMLKYIE